MPFGTPGTGAGDSYLAKLKDPSSYPHVDLRLEKCDAAFSGTLDEFRKQHEGDEALLARLLNKVKVCPCGKACAFTLTECNSCGAALDVPITTNDNVFMAFVYGVAKGKFPFGISIRAQTPKFLCFDDMLQLSPCHLNAIPTSTYIPDLRYLFKDPAAGLALINEMFSIAAQAALDQFWGDEAFRKKVFAGRPTPSTQEEVLKYAACGMNYPPSMYQLHLQFIHFPMLPFQYHMARKQQHYHHGRFFSLEYLRAALACGDKVKMDVQEDTPISSVIDLVAAAGVHYENLHRELTEKNRWTQEHFGSWSEDDFECCVVNDHVFDNASHQLVTSSDPKDIQVADKKALENYGRPHVDGRPTGLTYYSHAKKPEEVEAFPAGC
mmetsp:Transcript_43217/g.128037  ORF Transcript_43217/g.128037 Transcript_43217/m.128037 type:complete len:380 (+) Transcript_43217:49-1188(+)